MKKVIYMTEIYNDAIKDVFQLSYENELEKLTSLNISSIRYKTLTEDQIEQLAIKIRALPSKYQNILFLKYYFDNTSSEIDKILEVENSGGESLYIQKMLSNLLRLNNLWIDNISMKKACVMVFTQDIKDYENLRVLYKPNYSKTFRQKLKNINIKQSFNNRLMVIAKRVAIFILVCILSFSAVLTVNAETRERVFNWIIETFPQFSIFTPEDIDNSSSLELSSLRVNYIPSGFELVDIHEGHKMIIYNYSTSSGHEFDIKLFDISAEKKSYYDTEGIEVKEIIFKNSQAYTWQIDEITYLIWYQDGIECHIVGNLNKDEIQKVAKSISK